MLDYAFTTRPVNRMIDLTHQKPFAAGYNRLCFVHPDDPSRCLKVLRPENIEARYARQAWYKKLLGKERINDNRQETLAHTSLPLNHPDDPVWQHLPRFFGSEQTSLGPANVSEMITEANGTPGQTLETWLKTQGLTPDISAAIDRFCGWLLTTSLLTRNLLPHNLVVVDRNDQPELFLVDGLGAPTIPSYLSTIPTYRQRYIRRRITRFRQRIEWEVSGRPGTWENAQKIRRAR